MDERPHAFGGTTSKTMTQISRVSRDVANRRTPNSMRGDCKHIGGIGHPMSPSSGLQGGLFVS